MKIIRITFFTLLTITAMFGQIQSLQSEEAMNLFNNKWFTGVWKYYQNKLKTDSLNPELNYKMGICYLNSRSQKGKALTFFKKAIPTFSNTASVPKETYKLLGDAYYFASDFDQAIINYELYGKMINLSKGNQLLKEEISQKIEMCRMAKELIEQRKMIAGFNSHICAGYKKNNTVPAFTYSSSLMTKPSSVNLTFAVPAVLGTRAYDKNYFEDFCVTSKSNFYSKNVIMDTSTKAMEATIATSADRQFMLIYRDDNGEGSLYTSSLNGNEWTEPEPLNKAINNTNWEPNEFISTDGNTLYFSCEREGGFGGKDIYRCHKMGNGDWGKAINMGPAINTKYDEEAPFIHPDGITLYFSSDRYREKKGFDNFIYSLNNSDKNEAPVNVGYPAHKKSKSGYDEIRNSVKVKSQSEKEAYLITFSNGTKTPIKMLIGNIVSENGNIPEYVEITVANNETGDISGIYHSDSKTGRFAFLLPFQVNCNITFASKGCLFYSENIYTSIENDLYKSQSTIELAPVAPGSSVILNNVFFENGTAKLNAASNVELNNVVHLLEQHPDLVIELFVTLNKDATKADNQLARDKMQSVIDNLAGKGVNTKSIRCTVGRKSKKSVKKQETTANTGVASEKLELRILNFKS